MSKQLEGVKVGDMIKVRENYGNNYALHVVQRVTATRAVCEKAAFMIDSGAQVGTSSTGRWSTTKYGQIVPESDQDEVRQNLETKRRILNAQDQIQRATVNADNLAAAEAFLALQTAKSPA